MDTRRRSKTVMHQTMTKPSTGKSNFLSTLHLIVSTRMNEDKKRLSMNWKKISTDWWLRNVVLLLLGYFKHVSLLDIKRRCLVFLISLNDSRLRIFISALCASWRRATVLVSWERSTILLLFPVRLCLSAMFDDRFSKVNNLFAIRSRRSFVVSLKCQLIELSIENEEDSDERNINSKIFMCLRSGVVCWGSSVRFVWTLCWNNHFNYFN